MLFVTIASERESQALCDLTRHATGRIAARAWMVLWSAERVPVAEIAARPPFLQGLKTGVAPGWLTPVAHVDGLRLYRFTDRATAD